MRAASEPAEALVLVIETRKGPFRDHLVFFATARDVAVAALHCKSGEVYRFRHAAPDAWDATALHEGPSCTTCVDLRPPPDEILARFDAKSCRYEIRRADKLGARLAVRRDGPDAVRDFTRLYNGFVARRRFAPRMHRARLRRYLAVGNVFVASLDDQPLVGHVVVVDALSARARLVFSASTRLDAGPHRAYVSAVNRWLHWYEMRDYRNAGITTYDFGGVSPTSASAPFKLSFGGPLEEGSNLVIAGRAAGRVLTAVGATSGDFRHRHRAAVRAGS
jgi:hypothetical protein